jgi:hypothetical protein
VVIGSADPQADPRFVGGVCRAVDVWQERRRSRIEAHAASLADGGVRALGGGGDGGDTAGMEDAFVVAQPAPGADERRGVECDGLDDAAEAVAVTVDVVDADRRAGVEGVGEQSPLSGSQLRGELGQMLAAGSGPGWWVDRDPVQSPGQFREAVPGRSVRRRRCGVTAAAGGAVCRVLGRWRFGAAPGIAFDEREAVRALPDREVSGVAERCEGRGYRLAVPSDVGGLDADGVAAEGSVEAAHGAGVGAQDVLGESRRTGTRCRDRYPRPDSNRRYRLERADMILVAGLAIR